VLAGGMRSGNSSANLTRRKYAIHDKEFWNELLNSGMKPDDAQDKSQVGIVELFVKDGEELNFGATGLVNLEIKKEHRKKGIARKVVDAIRHTTGKELEIFDIKKHYVSTWRKLGVEQFHNGQGKAIKVSKHAGTIHGTMPSIEQEKSKEKSNTQEDGMSM
jgi:GNAT superfamily N-acetyltransferase